MAKTLQKAIKLDRGGSSISHYLFASLFQMLVLLLLCPSDSINGLQMGVLAGLSI